MKTESPWIAPPQRDKKLRDRKAERLARQAEFWGQRMEQANTTGQQAVAAVTWDRARAALDKLPDGARQAAYADLTAALDRIRETHTQ